MYTYRLSLVISELNVLVRTEHLAENHLANNTVVSPLNWRTELKREEEIIKFKLFNDFIDDFSDLPHEI